jgi:uncharacterized protein (TIGR02597 family)
MLSLVKEIMNMKKLNVALAIFVTAVMAGNAQTVTSDIVGYVGQSLAAGSDTIITPQVLRPTEYTGAVGGVTTSGTSATLEMTGASFTSNAFQYVANTQPKTYFALVTSGNLTGTTFRVTSNTASTLVVALDGLVVNSADITKVEIRPYWTLNTLFPSSASGVSFTPSTGSNAANRRTQLVLPNFFGTGVNRAPTAQYFYNPAVSDWVNSTAVTTKAGDTVIEPGQYIIHRNTGGTPVALNLTTLGEVLTKPASIYLSTLTGTTKNDNPIALPRATDYQLSAIGFTDANFVQSTAKNAGGRKDEVYVYATTGVGVNRAPTKVYFKYLNAWYDSSSTTTAVDPTIPAGSAVIIRKYGSDGNDKVLANVSNVTL